MAARRHGALPVVSAVAALAALALWALGALTPVERWTVDARFEVRGERPAPEVAVVEVDAESLRELGRWPFRRSLHARVIDRLREAGARGIAYDVQFSEPTEPVEDNALIEALGRRPGVVLATTEVDGGRTGVLGGDEVVRSVGAQAASALFGTDRGAVIRHMPTASDGLAPLADVTARQVLGPAWRPPPRGPRPWIDFAGPPGSVRTVSFVRVLRSRRAAAALRGRVVVVGASAPSLQDVHATATSGSGVMAGPEIQAHAIATALRGHPLRSAPWWVAGLAAVLLALAAETAFLRLRAPLAALAVLAAGGAWLVGAQAAFGAGHVVAAAPPLAALVLAALGALGRRLGDESRERRRVRALFARFVPEAVVDQVLAATDREARLGGVRTEATVLFCDLRGFTTFAETAPADRVIEVLNRYLTEMSEAVLDHGGTLVTYLGDGLMAVFGAPLARPDHADAAVAAAREMLEVRLPRFNARLTEEGDAPFRLGIGINSGPVMSGNVGSERRLEYAAIGDTTNVAARLESATKDGPHAVLVAAATRAALTRPDLIAGLEAVGDVTLRGRHEPIAVWTLGEAGSSLGSSGRSTGAWTAAHTHA